MTHEEKLPDQFEREPQALGDVLSGTDPIHAVHRVTGKTMEEWEEVYWQRRAKAIKSGLLKARTPFLDITEITGHLGLEGDDFVISLHSYDYVMGFGRNQRYMRRKHQLSRDESLDYFKQHEGRTAFRIAAWTIKADVFETLKRTVNIMLADAQDKASNDVPVTD